VTRRFLAALALCAPLLVAAPALAVTVDDVISMAQAGVSSDIILDAIKGERFRLTAADVTRLKAARVPDRGIEAMRKGAAARPDSGTLTDARRAADEFRRAEEERRAQEAREAEAARQRESARLRAEAEKLRREAEEMARQAKAAEQTAEARRQLIDAALREGMKHVGRGRYAEAARGLHRFLRGGLVPPNSYRYVDGEYGLAEALFGAGLHQAAAPHYVEVLRRGTATRRFAPAFHRLRAIAARTEYTHPVYELLATLDVSGEGEDFADEYHFALGEFYSRYGTPEGARSHFEKVREASPRYAAARYHVGLLLVGEKKNKQALRAFEAAAAAAAGGGELEVRDLATLALARVAFEVGSWAAARAYYGRVGPSSRHYARARYELLWTQFMAQDHRAALGTLQTMHAPLHRGEYLPDLYIVEATIYLDLCRFDEARDALAAFRARTAGMTEQVKTFLGNRPPAEVVLDAVLGVKRGALPEAVRRHVLRDVDFFNALTTYLQLRRELAQVSVPERSGGGNGQFGALTAELRPQLTDRLALYREQAAAFALRRLRDTQGDLGDLAIKADEIRFEIEFAEKERLADETLQLYQGAAGPKAPTGPRRDRVQLERAEEFWPDEGEYWEDEVPSYRSFLRGACSDKAH
jgi:TolA-binding protein